MPQLIPLHFLLKMANPRLKPAGRNDGHTADYSKITDKIYLGSNLCKGNVCPIHGKEFKKLGVTAEINLSFERKEIPPDEVDIYSWIPVVDGYPPTQKQLVMGSGIINESVNCGTTIYVHCTNGHGRGPTMVAAYFIRYKNMSVNEANDFIKSKRPEIHIEERQWKALEQFATK